MRRKTLAAKLVDDAFALEQCGREFDLRREGIVDGEGRDADLAGQVQKGSVAEP